MSSADSGYLADVELFDVPVAIELGGVLAARFGDERRWTDLAARVRLALASHWGVLVPTDRIAVFDVPTLGERCYQLRARSEVLAAGHVWPDLFFGPSHCGVPVTSATFPMDDPVTGAAGIWSPLHVADSRAAWNVLADHLVDAARRHPASFLTRTSTHELLVRYRNVEAWLVDEFLATRTAQRMTALHHLLLRRVAEGAPVRPLGSLIEAVIESELAGES